MLSHCGHEKWTAFCCKHIKSNAKQISKTIHDICILSIHCRWYSTFSCWSTIVLAALYRRSSLCIKCFIDAPGLRLLDVYARATVRIASNRATQCTVRGNNGTRAQQRPTDSNGMHTTNKLHVAVKISACGTIARLHKHMKNEISNAPGKQTKNDSHRNHMRRTFNWRTISPACVLTSPLTSSLSISHFRPAAAAQIWMGFCMCRPKRNNITKQLNKLLVCMRVLYCCVGMCARP